VFRDPTRARLWPQLARRDCRAFAHLLTPDRLARAAAAAAVPWGQGPLNLATLTWLALACAWHRLRPFADVLGLTLKLLRDATAAPDPPPPPPRPRHRRHHPRVADPTRLSEEAFTQARGRLPWAFWPALLGLLADDFAAGRDRLLRWRGHRLLCLDGTTVDLPNWPALAEHFGTAGRGKGRRQAQARLVLLQLTAARLGWRCALTPLAQSEQAVAAGLLGQLRRDDLVLMDRGFFSYALLALVQARGAFFVTRLRRQVQPRAVRRLGPGDRLAVWRPASSAAKRAARERGLPQLAVRVIDYRVKGFRPGAVVTNLLDHRAVPAEEFVRLAAQEEGRRVEAGLYHRRWGVELSFLELKVTQGLEGSLRSRTPGGVYYEVGGHLLLYQLTRWLLAEAAERAGPGDPLRLSYQAALAELEDLRPALLRASEAKVKRLWRPRLLGRLGGHEVPWRPGRHYPRPHDTQAKAKGHGRCQPRSKRAGRAGPAPPRRRSRPPPKAKPAVREA
jgi:hypothetical protein